jgi:hypothetical protein
MTKRTIKRTASTPQPRTPSGAARVLIIPKKGSRLGAARIRKAIERVVAAREMAQS